MKMLRLSMTIAEDLTEKEELVWTSSNNIIFTYLDLWKLIGQLEESGANIPHETT